MRPFRFNLLTAAVMTTAMATALMPTGSQSVWAAPAGNPSPAMRQAYAEQLKVLQEMMAKADGQLYGVMEYVAQRVVSHYHWKGSMPQPGWDQDTLRTALARQYSGNPYFIADEKFQQIDQAAADHLSLQFLYDSNLSEEVVAKYKLRAPDDWRAKPGTITVITGKDNLALVWGANAEGVSLKVKDSSKPRFLILRPQHTW